MTPITWTLLGTGTSQGVPTIGCSCETCTSTDPHDSRLRPSIMFQSGGLTVVIDTSSDFRQQMLTHRVSNVDAVLYTHHHFDHIGGFDDIRSYNFISGNSMRVYGMQQTLDEIRTTFRYAFDESTPKGGGLPQVELLPLPDESAMVDVFGIPVQTIPVFHGELPVLGFRVGDFAYITDTNNIPEASFELLENLEVLVLDALRFKPHPTHFSLDESIAAATRIGAKQTYFTHIAHSIMHSRDSKLLPAGQAFGYDGLRVDLQLENT